MTRWSLTLILDISLGSAAACRTISVLHAICSVSLLTANSRLVVFDPITSKPWSSCLFDAKEVSLRDKMRNEASDAELMQSIAQTVLRMQEKHAKTENIDIVTNHP